MAKAHVTQKWVNQNFQRRLYTGYCNLENLLKYREPAYYTTRREGWGADIYLIDQQTVIITGYAPFGNIRIPYELARQVNSMGLSEEWDRTDREFHDYLIQRLIDETMKGATTK